MKREFTRGPWMAAAKYSSVAGLPVVQQGKGRSIASVTFFNLGEGFENHERESYANARLIAAAPDMLHALDVARIALLNGSRTTTPVELVTAAIAKATGEA